MQAEAPDRLFSAVVLSFNSSRYIEACVDSLRGCFAEFEQPSEILIVENGSTDGSRQLVETLAASAPDEIVPIYSPVNLGTTVSRNRALRAARGRYILVIDSDATIEADALGRLRAVLDGHQDVGIAVPQLRYPDGRFQISTDQFPTLPHKLKRFFALKSMEERAAAPDGLTDVDYAISACWLLRREVVSEVGLLDERIFYSPEDVDYCVRVWQAGYRVCYVPDAVAVHDAQELSRGDKLSRFTFSHAGGLAYFFRKHGYWLSRDRFVRRLRREAAAR